jgi:hypothetical protein
VSVGRFSFGSYSGPSRGRPGSNRRRPSQLGHRRASALELLQSCNQSCSLNCNRSHDSRTSVHLPKRCSDEDKPSLTLHLMAEGGQILAPDSYSALRQA